MKIYRVIEGPKKILVRAHNRMQALRYAHLEHGFLAGESGPKIEIYEAPVTEARLKEVGMIVYEAEII